MWKGAAPRRPLRRRRRAREGPPPLEILLVERVRDLPSASGLGVEEPALAELLLLAVRLDDDAAPMDEVQLVLLVVPVQEPVEAGRIDDGVDAERGHSERLADLAKAGAGPELVDRSEFVPHGHDPLKKEQGRPRRKRAAPIRLPAVDLVEALPA